MFRLRRASLHPPAQILATGLGWLSSEEASWNHPQLNSEQQEASWNHPQLNSEQEEASWNHPQRSSEQRRTASGLPRLQSRSAVRSPRSCREGDFLQNYDEGEAESTHHPRHPTWCVLPEYLPIIQSISDQLIVQIQK